MKAFVSMLHDLQDGKLGIQWGWEKTSQVFWDEIKLKSESSNERALKRVLAKMSRNGASLSMKCYVIHFADQSFVIQREWDES